MLALILYCRPKGRNQYFNKALTIESTLGLTVLSADELFTGASSSKDDCDLNSYIEWRDWKSTIAGMSQLLELQKEESREEQQRTIKQLASLLLIGWYLHCNSDQESASDSPAIFFILSAAGNLSRIWESCSNSKNLRLMPSSSVSGSDAVSYFPTILLVELNEDLELIRLKALKRAGYSSIKALETPSLLEQLSTVLSISFITAMEFSKLSKSIMTLNLEFLSIFASVLPLSWFSGEFLLTLGGVLTTDFYASDSNNPMRSMAISAALTLLQSHSLLEESGMSILETGRISIH